MTQQFLSQAHTQQRCAHLSAEATVCNSTELETTEIPITSRMENRCWLLNRIQYHSLTTLCVCALWGVVRGVEGLSKKGEELMDADNCAVIVGEWAEVDEDMGDK